MRNLVWSFCEYADSFPFIFFLGKFSLHINSITCLTVFNCDLLNCFFVMTLTLGLVLKEPSSFLCLSLRLTRYLSRSLQVKEPGRNSPQSWSKDLPLNANINWNTFLLVLGVHLNEIPLGPFLNLTFILCLLLICLFHLRFEIALSLYWMVYNACTIFLWSDFASIHRDIVSKFHIFFPKLIKESNSPFMLVAFRYFKSKIFIWLCYCRKTNIHKQQTQKQDP